MVRIKPKAFRLLLPTPADVLVGRQSSKHLESFGKVISGKGLREMLLELVVRLIVVALNGRILDGAIHPFDLAVSPRMIDFGQPMFDAVFLADAVEQVLESPLVLAETELRLRDDQQQRECAKPDDHLAGSATDTKLHV